MRRLSAMPLSTAARFPWCLLAAGGCVNSAALSASALPVQALWISEAPRFFRQLEDE